MRFIKGVAYAGAVLGGLAIWVTFAERSAAEDARSLCSAIPVGMPTTEARRAVAAAEGLERRLDTPTGILAIFSGAFMFSRYTCEVTLAERVTATRLNHLD
jgi:hypothetical protein